MSVLGGSDSTTKQTVSNAPQTASDQAVVIGLRGSSVLGDKNSGNIKLGKNAVYNPSVTYTTQGYSAEDLDRITGSFNQSLSAAITGLGQQRQVDAGGSLPDVIEDRLTEQIANAPDDAKKKDHTLMIVVGVMLAIGAAALAFGRKGKG
jgi:hypothetical protein